MPSCLDRSLEINSSCVLADVVEGFMIRIDSPGHGVGPVLGRCVGGALLP